MSNFQDIYRDLPSRVNEVWQRTKNLPEKEAKDLSVTAMLMAAAAGLAMPLEDIHIAGKRSKRPNHVLLDANDHDKYKIALGKFKEFLDDDISKYEIFKGVKFPRCKKIDEIKIIGEYGGGEAVDIKKHKISFAFSIIRNALAHNNIATFGTNIENIEKLTFFSENWTRPPKRKIDGWNLMTISTDDFSALLKYWFNFIDESMK